MKKTIEELEGKVWGEPDFQSHVVTTCHRLRKKPIDQFTVEDLRIMIGQQVGTQYIVFRALDVLEADPLAEGDFFPGDLLQAMIRLPETYWKDHRKEYRRLVKVSAMAARELSQKPEENQTESNRAFIRALESIANEKAVQQRVPADP